MSAEQPPVPAGGATRRWALVLATPLGRQHVTLVIREDAGVLAGEAIGREEAIQLQDLARDGNRLTWTQTITRPMRLVLAFDVTVDGEQMAGTAKAGRLPSSRVRGSLLPPEDGQSEVP